MALKFYTQQDIINDQKFYSKISKVYPSIDGVEYCIGGTSLGTLQPSLLLTRKSLIYYSPIVARTTVQEYALNTITDIKKSKSLIPNIIIQILKVENIEFKTSVSSAEIDQMISKIQEFISCAMEELSPIEMQQQISNAQQIEIQRQQLEELKKAEANKVRCPKCKSTSISLEKKRLSLGRAATGAVIGAATFGVGTAAGAVGAVTSKKKYCVCMNCGHKWKL